MILTVTLNTGIDRTLVLPRFEWNQTIRAKEVALGMGGKATDASWVLGELGIENTAIGLAAGCTGQQMEQLLQEKGVRTQFIQVEGETRTNTIVIRGGGGGQSTLTTNSLIVKPEHLAAFEKTYEAALDPANCVIIGGSLPSNTPVTIYTRIVGMARKRNIPVVFDASGPELKAGLAGRPTLVKPNREELEELLQIRVESQDDVYHAACQIREQYGCMVVATLGSRGALAVTGEGAFFIEPVHVNVISSAGAGDAILAGLAHSFAARLPILEGLRLGFAAAAAVLVTLPTADCRREDVHSFLPRIQIREFIPRQV